MSDARCFSVCLCMLMHVLCVVRVLSPYIYTIGAMLPTLCCGFCSWVVSNIRPELFPVGNKMGLCSNSAFNGTSNRGLTAERLFSPRCVMQPGYSHPHAINNSKEFLRVCGRASTLIKFAWSVQVLHHFDGDYNPLGYILSLWGLVYSSVYLELIMSIVLIACSGVAALAYYFGYVTSIADAIESVI